MKPRNESIDAKKIAYILEVAMNQKPKFNISSLTCGLLFFFISQSIFSATFIVTNLNDSAQGSLRQAIQDSNSLPGTDTVVFVITNSPRIIKPQSSLPVITDPIIIDGTTQPGFNGVPIIELDGSSAGDANGLRIKAGGSTVRGLAINRFLHNGISIDTNGGNHIEGNLIGTDTTGTLGKPNGENGIVIGAGVSDCTIGEVATSTRNIISGNDASGIRVKGSNNIIQGNYIGTDITGTKALGNGGATNSHNIWIDNAGSNIIGGTVLGARNIISGAPHGVGILINGSLANSNVIQNNFVGTNVKGDASVPNNASGIIISDGAGNNQVINNLISGNRPAGAGVAIRLGANGNIVRGNKIGTDITGSRGLGNFRGVYLAESINNIVGGPQASDSNLISANASSGVVIQFLGTHDNIVQGNFIGTDINGGAPLGNSQAGVSMGDGVSNNIIENNLISANIVDGIQILSVGDTGNKIRGNKIGTDITASFPLGNGSDGILINGAPGNSIGGSGSNDANIISGNVASGIRLNGTAASRNAVQGNFIGTKSNPSQSLPNGNRGIFITNGAHDNVIGGRASGEGNTIAFNIISGVGLIQTGTGNTIIKNSIYDNQRLGISFGDGTAVTSNDQGDIDTGSNNFQNFPILTAARIANSSITINGNLSSTINTSFNIDFFLNATCDPLGFGEGKSPIGSTSIITNASGVADFSVELALNVPAGSHITSTATDSAGNTSEFSACVTVQGCSSCIFENSFEP